MRVCLSAIVHLPLRILLLSWGYILECNVPPSALRLIVN